MSKLTSTIRRYSPIILSIFAAGGVAGTFVLTAKAAPIVERKRETAKNKDNGKMTVVEVVRVYKCYIPAVSVGLATIGCIFGACVISRRQQTCLASAYAMLDQAYKAYRGKIVDMLGEDADQYVEESIQREKDGTGEEFSWSEPRIFYEEHYGKFFERTMEEVFQAEYHTNRNFALRGYAQLNEFYEFLGLPKIDDGDQLGWSLGAGEGFYGYSWIDFEHKYFATDDGLECMHIIMPFPPTSDYLEME